MSETCLCRDRRERYYFIAALIFAVVAIFTNLATEGIYAAQEGRTSIILRNMLRTGDCFEMQVPYGVPYEKPIGHYWLCLPTAYLTHMDGDALQSAVEWGIRLPSAFAALLTVLLAGLLAKRIYDCRTGAMTIMILATMSNFDKLARLGHIDMALCGAFMLTMYFLYTGYVESGKTNWRIYLFYAALGWGMLLKGPLVLILAGLVVVGVMISRGKEWYHVLRDLRLVRGLLIFVIIAAPWYIYECIHSHGAFYEEFIVRQNIARLIGDPHVYNKKSPFWHYIPKFITGALPWSLVAVAGMVVYFKRLILFRVSPGTRFLLIWLLTGFVFFSCSSVKRVDYILPLFPALGILTARLCAEWFEKLPAVPRKWWVSIAAVILGIILVGFAVNSSGAIVRLGEAIRDGKYSVFTRRDGMTIAMISEFIRDRSGLLLSGIGLVAGLLVVAGIALEKRRGNVVFCLISLVVLGVFLTYHLGIEPGTDRMRSVKDFARQVRQVVPPDATVVIAGTFNTEMIYFLDRNYRRKVSPTKRTRARAIPYLDSDCYSKVAPTDHWVVASPDFADELREEEPQAWKEHFRTIENHHYPAILLERK